MIDNSVVIELGEVRTIPRHAHNGYEILHLLKGSVELDYDGACYLMRPGDVVVCNSGEVHGAGSSSPNIMFRLIVAEEYLLRETGEARCRFACNSCGGPAEGEKHNYDQIRSKLTRLMLSYFEKGQPRSRLEIKAALLGILSFLFEHFLTPRGEPAAPGQSDRMQSVIRYIHRNYKNDISLQFAAEQEQTSIYHLSRQFKKKMGVSFTEYIRNVRLAGAVDDLLRSREPVIKIALGNGFSNVSAFNRAFRRMYQETPAKYRAARYVGRSPASARGELAQAFSGQEDLVKYLRQFDTKYRAKSGAKSKSVVDAAAPVSGRFLRPMKIIRIGRVNELLKIEVREQLDYLRGKTPLDYVHFACVYDDGMYPYRGVEYANYEYFHAFDYLHGASLKPFIQIRMQAMRDVPAEEAAKRLSLFLNAISERYPKEFLSQWRFEIAYPAAMNENDLWEGYGVICRTVRQAVPSAEFAFQFQDLGPAFPDGAAMLPGFLRRSGAAGIAPSFLTFYADSPDCREDLDDDEYEYYRVFNTKRVQRLAEYLGQGGAARPELILMQWNTLSGFTTAESNVFYRSALFLDEIIHVRDYVCGVSFWLNTYIHEAATGRDHFCSLALFLFQKLKRPVYFALTLLDRLSDDIIHQEENLIVTRDASGSLSILAMNPCYFKPGYASDKSFTDSVRRMFTIEIENIRGRHIIERCHMDGRLTAVYDRWANMGFPPIVDRHVMEHLDKTVNMDYSIYEENIARECKLSVTLEFNEAVVVHIKKNA